MHSYRSPLLTLAVAVSLLSACSDSSNPTTAPPPPPSPQALGLTQVVGGQLSDLVVSHQFAYLATGRVIAVWDHGDPSAPAQVGTVNEPVGGLITGLAVYGDHIYASWRTGNDQSGVTIYALTDPTQPELVNEVPIGIAFSHVGAIAAANNHLYLFDSENGIWVGSLADPEAPNLTTNGNGLAVLSIAHWLRQSDPCLWQEFYRRRRAHHVRCLHARGAAGTASLRRRWHRHL